MHLNTPVPVPSHRRVAADAIWAALAPARRVALCTHINADGDGCGSEAALARLLAQRGIDVRIVNPTPWPGMFTFLLGDDVVDRTREGATALHDVDKIVVLDISDLGRLGALAPTVRARRADTLVVDHHLPGRENPGDIALDDTTACATGELIYDIAVSLGFTITSEIAMSLYTAILTDTGGFRFANTSPRCHAVASALLAAGVAPEEMYRRIYASVPVARLYLLRDALDTLQCDPEVGMAWVEIKAGALEAYGLQSEDLDGIAEYPRSIAGTKVAILFRDLGHGKVKVSFRSTSGADSDALARRFGGGGHARAAGALIPGSLDEVKAAVIAAAREMLAPGHGS